MAAVMGMNTMDSVIGVPIAGIVAEATTWRVSVGIVGVLAVLAAVVLFVRLPNSPGTNRESRVRALYALIITDRSAVSAIVSSFLGALFWFTWATYIVVFFQRRYGLSQGLASAYALTQGLGVLIGSQVGGRLGDRRGHRRIVAGSVLIAGFLLLLQTNLPLPLAAAGALNLLLSGVIGARFATNTSLMTEQVPEARGTMLALSASVAGLATVFAATLGGFFVDGPGFWMLGAFCFAAAERYGPDFFGRIGRKGGKAVSEKYGAGHFERIGRRGGQKVASLVERAKHLEAEAAEKPEPVVRPEESIGA